jgi:DNA-binding MarR family transcriptional regulator
MEKISLLVIKTDIAARKASAYGLKRGAKNPLSLKAKLLHLLLSGMSSPADLTAELCINKCNLTALAKELETSGLIVKRKSGGDKRGVLLLPTQKGADWLEECSLGLEKAAVGAFGGEYQAAAEKLSEAIKVLEFL